MSMDFNFDAFAAEQLIAQISQYCSGIQHDAQDVLRLLHTAEKWQDTQGQAFKNNVTEIANDLNQILRLIYYCIIKESQN